MKKKLLENSTSTFCFTSHFHSPNIQFEMKTEMRNKNIFDRKFVYFDNILSKSEHG